MEKNKKRKIRMDLTKNYKPEEIYTFSTYSETDAMHQLHNKKCSVSTNASWKQSPGWGW